MDFALTVLHHVGWMKEKGFSAYEIRKYVAHKIFSKLKMKKKGLENGRSRRAVLQKV